MKQVPLSEPPATVAGPSPVEGGEALDLKALLDVIKRRKLIFIQTLVAVFLVGGVATLLTSSTRARSGARPRRLSRPPTSTATATSTSSPGAPTVSRYGATTAAATTF